MSKEVQIVPAAAVAEAGAVPVTGAEMKDYGLGVAAADLVDVDEPLVAEG